MSKWSPKIQAMIDTYGEEKAMKLMELHSTSMKKKYPTLAFIPNRGQWRVVKHMEADHVPINLGFLAGNGVGKTCFLANFMVGMLWPQYLNPDWLGKLKFWGRIPGDQKGRLVCSSDDASPEGSLYDEIIKWFPKGLYEIKQDGKNRMNRIICNTKAGMVGVQVRTHDQKIEAHAGPNLDWVLANEPMPEKLYGENMARLRNSRLPMFWFFMTPLKVSAWLYDLMIDGEDGYDTVTTEASIYDNCKDIEGTNGVLPRENVDAIVKNIRLHNPDEADARIYGKFQHLAGRVYKGFTREVHVIDDFDIPDNWMLSISIDPHDSKPPAVGIFAQDPLNNLYLVGNYPSKDYKKIAGTTQTYAHHVEGIWREVDAIGKRSQVLDKIMDPNKGRTKAGKDAKTIQKEYSDLGMKTRTNINDDLAYGHGKVRDMLYFDKELYEQEGNLTETNKPKFFIFRNARNGHNALSKYSFKDADRQGSNMTSSLDQSYKDFADVIRYRAVSMKAYKNPKDNSGSSFYDQIEAGRKSKER